MRLLTQSELTCKVRLLQLWPFYTMLLSFGLGISKTLFEFASKRCGVIFLLAGFLTWRGEVQEMPCNANYQTVIFFFFLVEFGSVHFVLQLFRFRHQPFCCFCQCDLKSTYYWEDIYFVAGKVPD